MEHPAQLAIKLLIAFSFFTGCNQPVKDSAHFSIMNENDAALHSVNGVLLYKQQPFTGVVFSLFNNRKDTSSVSSFLNGKENGIWKKWYAPGKLKEQREFKDGFKAGTCATYWENGNKKELYLFNKDEYDGTCYEWDSNGKVAREMNYAKGHEDGVQKMYYSNGKIRSNYVMVKGRRFGLLGTKNCVNVSDSIFKK
jgi:antitoxin component YwqK of YwqJK toxin-antitoxin module